MEIKPDIIRIAGEEAVSKTIEELLDINELLPKRSNDYVNVLQEQQLSNTDNRWETEELTEKQFQKSKTDTGKQKLDLHKDDSGITEIRLNDKKNDQRRPEAYENKENISPLWKQIKKQEKDREKLDKGQLDKKRK